MPWENGKYLQRQVRNLACLCAKAVCVSKRSLRGQDLVFRIGKAPAQGRERCTAGSLALLRLRDWVWKCSLCFEQSALKAPVDGGAAVSLHR